MSGTKAGGMKAAATNKATPAVLPLTQHLLALQAPRVAASPVVVQLKKLPNYLKKKCSSRTLLF